MTTLLLVRHGETDWNAGRRWQGHTDVPLNARGRAQAAALAEELAADPPSAIYTSDLSRARETAEIVGTQLGVPVILEPRLREIHVGSREGLTAEEVGDREWDGEPHAEHGVRVLAAVRDVAAAHPNGRVLLPCATSPVSSPAHFVVGEDPPDGYPPIEVAEDHER